MSEAKIQGRRVYADSEGILWLKEGDYGYSPKTGYWAVRPPGCHAGGIPHHTVVEHEDGTISVSPSIVLYEGHDGVTWHGYLEYGFWRTI